MEFSEFHGENIQLADDRKSAKWTITFSGGLIFSENDLQGDDVMNFLLEKSGHVNVGYIHVNPEDVVNQDFRNILQDMVTMKEIRVHKLRTKIKMCRKVDDNIILTINNEKHEHQLSTDEKVLVMIYMKFGDVQVTIDAEGPRCHRFHSNCGTNINLNDERTLATLIDPNPATVCCLDRKLHQGETVKIRIKALQINNKTPSRFHLVLGYSELNPRELKENDPGSFRVTGLESFRENVNRDTRGWKIVKQFDKEVCPGNLNISITADNKLSYKYDHSVSEKGEENLDLTYQNGEVLVVFGLWRTSVEILELRKPLSSIPDDNTYLTPQNIRRESNIQPETQSNLQMEVPLSSDPTFSSWQTLNPESVLMSSGIHNPSDVVDARIPEIVQHDWGTTVVQERSSDSNKREHHGMDRELNIEQIPEQRQFSRTNLQKPCDSETDMRSREEILYQLSETVQNQSSGEDSKIVLKESVQINFTYLLDNLILNEFCDYLYQGQYLTRSDMELVSNYHRPRETRREFLLNILSTRPINIELLKQACVESKQEHIFEKLVKTEKKS